MMNPKALEALRKARELFAEKADDIPNDAVAVEPIRKPKVHLIPTNAPKFTKESMKQEHKQESKAEGLTRVMRENGLSAPELIDKYVEMSVTKAVEACFAKGIKTPAQIAKETGKNINQIYTAIWHIKQRKKKAKAQAKAQRQDRLPTPTQQAIQDDWDREGTPFEDAHMVVLHSRDWYEKEIDKLYEANNNLLMQIQELKTVINYLERKVMVK